MKEVPESYIVNKVVLVTGASSGIGVAIALTFARYGARLVLASSKTDRLDALSDQIIAAGGQALVVPVDLTNIQQIRELIDRVISSFGRIDVLINNPGWYLPGWYEELSPQELRLHFEENVLGIAELTREVIPVMKKQHSGQILNLLSYTSQFAVPSMTAFSGTNYALEGLSDGLRRELAPWGIQVSRIHIGNVSGMKPAQDTREKALKAPSIFPRGEITADQVALELIKVSERPQRTVYLGAKNKSFIAFSRRFPGLADAYSIRWVRRKRRQELRQAAGKKGSSWLSRLAPAAIIATTAAAGYFVMRNVITRRNPEG